MSENNGSGKYPIEAGIPDLKRREKERHQGGAAPWMTGSPRGGSEFLSGSSRGAFSRILGGNGSAGGIFDGLANFLASKLGMLFITAAVAGASTYSLYSIYGPAAPKPARQPVHFPKTEYSEKSTRNLPAEGPAMSSLEQLAAANRAAPDQGSAAPAVSQNAADSSAAQAPAQPNNNYDTTAPADQSMGQRKPSLQKVVALGASGQGQGQGRSAAGSAASPSPAKPSEEALLAQAKSGHGTLEGMSGGGVRPSALGSSRSALGRGNLAKGSSLASLRQLGAAAGYSIGAKAAGESESKAYTADKAFNGTVAGPAAGGLPILGAGTGSGAGPAGVSEGGPIQPTSPNPRAPQPQSTQDVTPWTSTLMMGVSMLTIASIIILMIGILGKMKHSPVIGNVIKGIMTMLLFMAIGLAMMAVMAGATMMSRWGQSAQGAILMTGGLIAAAAAVMAYVMGRQAYKPQGPTLDGKPMVSTAAAHTMWPMMMILGGIAGIGASIGALLANGKVPIPH